MFKEQRIAPREALALPLSLGDGSSAVTRDMSASGMYLEVGGTLHIGDGLVLELHLAEAKIKFTAEGRVVRVEHRDGNTGIAVALTGSRLETLG